MTPTPPQAGERAEALDAARYRWLRRKVCIIDQAGFMSDHRYAKFEILDMPYPTYLAPDAGVEFDATIDAAIAALDSEESK